MASPKRPAVDNINDRSTKRRSLRACLTCRNRKVRCDAEVCGTPCNNCRLDSIECILMESNRGRRNVNDSRNHNGTSTDTDAMNAMAVGAAAGSDMGSAHNAALSTESQSIVVISKQPTGYRFPAHSYQQSQQLPQQRHQHRQRQPYQDQHPDQQPQQYQERRQEQQPQQYQEKQREQHQDQQLPQERHPPSPELQHQQPEELNSNHPSPKDQESRDYFVSLSFDDGRAMDKLQDRHGERYRRSSGVGPNGNAPPLAGIVTISPDDNLDVDMGHGFTETRSSLLPSYIRPPPKHITATDMTYLAEKGALTIPDTQFRNKILSLYVDIVHPFLPAIDVGDFLNSIASGTGESPISLLLFQCVMFAGVAFADAKFLQKRGFQDRREAREVFFRRVRLLYGLDYELDRLILVQSLLLMTYWFGGPDDAKDTWHWAGIAISLAQECGFHRDSEHMKITASEKRLRRRIWWSCYIRDRLIALGIRRPTRLSDDNTNVPMLDLADFEPIKLSASALEIFGPLSLMRQGDAVRKAVAMTCIELAKLCVCLGRSLHSQYSVIPNHSSRHASFMKFSVLPKPWDIRERQLEKRNAELDDWLESLDARCRYTPAHSRSTQSNDSSSMFLRLHQIQLHMIYLTTVGVLHRPQVFSSAADAGGVRASRRKSRQKLRDAAKALNKLAFDLRSEKLLPFLSTSGVTAFLSATIIHLFDIQSQDEEVSNVSIGRFYHCVEVLQQLQDIYVSADAAIGFLETVIKMVDVKIPGMAMGLRPLSGSRMAQNSNITNNTLLNSQSNGFQGRAATAYVTPSASATQSLDDVFPRNIGSSLQTGRQQQDFMRNPPPLTAEDIALASGGMHDPDHVLPETSRLDSWNGVEGFLPGLVNVDVDTALDASASFDWGLSQLWNSPEDVSAVL